MRKTTDILYIDTLYRPIPGSFAKLKNKADNRHEVGQWYYCRDIFHKYLHNLKLFFFSHSTSKGRSIIAFMQKIEKKLQLKDLSEYGLTQRKTIIWIKPSRWWTQKAMRRSLFTALLRTAENYSYSKDNFEEALFSHLYTKGTRCAIERFLAGYTRYTGKKRGWYKQFCDLKSEEIDFLLVKE